MRLKSFHGTTMTEAMRLVREALGDDAIIVATREDPAGGIRVTAALDDQPVASIAKTASRSTSAHEAQPVNSLSHDDDEPEVITKISEALARHQVPSHIAERLIASATHYADDDAVMALGAAFDMHLTFEPLAVPTKPIVVIGPPGAGKTSVIAKLATKAALAKQPVNVITTDLNRAGGIEQISAYTRLLKIPLLEIEDIPAIRDAINLHQQGLILIDTAGHDPFRTDGNAILHDILATAGGDAMLVLPSGLDASEAEDMTRNFIKLGAKRLIVTRLDITRRLGSLVRLAFETRIPLANYTASRTATEPVHPLNPIALARLLLAKPIDLTPSNPSQGGRR